MNSMFITLLSPLPSGTPRTHVELNMNIHTPAVKVLNRPGATGDIYSMI